MKSFNDPFQIGPAFLDCGAHSVFTGVWNELPIDDYIKFTDENHKYFQLVASPDVVGDTDNTTKNFEYFIKRTKVPKEKILSVFHIQTRNIKRFEEVINYSLEAGLSWIAIGGALGVGFTKIQKILALEEVFKKLGQYKNPFKVHLFGIHHPENVKLFRPNSVDSATFIGKSTYTKFHEYELDKWIIKPDHTMYKGQTRKMITDESIRRIKHHAEALKPFGIDFGDIDHIRWQIEKVPDTYKFMVVNALNVMEFEMYAREKLKYDFTHFITCPFSMLHIYNGVIIDMFRCAFHNRALLSYANLYNLSPADKNFILSILEESPVKI